MSRVLLMVQGAGDKRPKVRPATSMQIHWIRTEQSKRDGLSKAYSRWWLVECDNAEAGRAIIHDMPKWDVGQTQCAIGRILATGGAREGGEA